MQAPFIKKTDLQPRMVHLALALGARSRLGGVSPLAEKKLGGVSIVGNPSILGRNGSKIKSNASKDESLSYKKAGVVFGEEKFMDRKWDIYDVRYVSFPVTEKNPIFATFYYTYDKKRQVDFDLHFAVEIGIVLSGKMRRIYKNWETELAPGGIWYCGIWEPHGWEITETPCKVLTFFVWPPMLLHLQFQESSEFDLMTPFVIHPSRRPRLLPGIPKKMNELCKKIERIQSHSVSYSSLRLKLVLMETLLDIQTDWETPSLLAPSGIIPADHYVKIVKAIEMIFTSRKFISEKKAAAKCNMSRCSFTKNFKLLMGINFSEFAICHRLTKAAKEILETDVPIKSIASNWGFFDTSHFLKSFRTHYMCTPTEYRKKYNPQCVDDTNDKGLHQSLHFSSLSKLPSLDSSD